MQRAGHTASAILFEAVDESTQRLMTDKPALIRSSPPVAGSRTWGSNLGPIMSRIRDHWHGEQGH